MSDAIERLLVGPCLPRPAVRIKTRAELIGPTSNILEMAGRAPGGVIRWREARDAYVEASQAANRHERRGEHNHHIWIKQVLDRYFVKVEGIDGHYVLASAIQGED